MSTIRERGRPIWVSAPVGRKLADLLAKRTEELQRQVTMSEVIEQLLTRVEGFEVLAAHTSVLADRKPVQP